MSHCIFQQCRAHMTFTSPPVLKINWTGVKKTDETFITNLYAIDSNMINIADVCHNIFVFRAIFIC